MPTLLTSELIYHRSMLQFLERMDLKTGCSTSRLSFEMQGGGAWSAWDRYLTVDGKRAYHLGNMCQTCAFLFQRLDGANSSVEVENTSEALRAGVSGLTHRVVGQIGGQLPEGEYMACLIEADLNLVTPGQPGDFFKEEQIALYGVDSFWDLPHNPRVSYYRAGERLVGEHAALYNFVVPMFPESWLEAPIIADYTKRLEESDYPTAVAIALLDVKGPANWGDDAGPIHEHWALTHFLVDGHHKAAAARRAGLPLRLLSFIAVTQGISERAQLARALE